MLTRIFIFIMDPRRAVRGRPTRRNIEEQAVPNAPDVQTQEEKMLNSMKLSGC